MIYTNPKQCCSQSSMRGFTLIELMVAMVLSLFLVGGVILMYASSKAAYLDSNQLSRLQENIRFASDYMVRDIRNAGFRDELTLSVSEVEAIQAKVAEIRNGGTELVIRYAGRGHCEGPFSEDDEDAYGAVENRYYFDADTGELRCAGAVPDLANPDDVAADGTGRALVAGLTDLSFQFVMANGDTGTGGTTGTGVCRENTTPATLCLAAQIGMEFESLRDLDNAGQFEERFVELTSTFRNSAIDQIYAPCARLEKKAGEDEGAWC